MLKLKIASGPLAERKRELLRLNQLKLEVDPSCTDGAGTLRLARIIALSEDELYFLQPQHQFLKQLNPRNEAAALSLLLDLLSKESGQYSGLQQWLQEQCRAYATNTHSADCLLTTDIDLPDAYDRWAQDNGVQTVLQPAVFSGNIRGLSAAGDLEAGTEGIRVPQALLISEETARQSDLGPVLTQFSQLGGDSIAVIWTMVERHDPESPWALFWQSLPQTLQSGLSMSDRLLHTLEGTPAYAECSNARQHIKEQYKSLKPILDALVAAYPTHLEAAWFSWDAYLWAVQLWYAYAMQVKWPDGTCRECLVPYASLLNHSPYPHIVRYGQLDLSTQQLCFPLFRPITKGEQCFLSYGPLPNLKLMLFYGMAIPDNPHDVVPIQLQGRIDHRQDQAQAILQGLNISLQHKVCSGPLHVALQKAACVLGLPPASLEDAMGSEDALDMSSSAGKPAQQSVLVPVITKLKQLYQRSAARCTDMQHSGTSEPMLSCVCTYLKGATTRCYSVHCIMDLILATSKQSCSHATTSHYTHQHQRHCHRAGPCSPGRDRGCHQDCKPAQSHARKAAAARHHQSRCCHQVHCKHTSHRDAARVVARSRDALRLHLQRQQDARRILLPPVWEPLPQPDSPQAPACSPAASPGRACDPGRSHRPSLPVQIWAENSNSCSSTSTLSKGMQTVQESLQAEYDELYEHYQELAEQVRYLEDEGEGTEPSSDLDVLHVALREVVDACDNKAAQMYALQQF